MILAERVYVAVMKLVLVAIVKNEGHVLPRLLSSVDGLVDDYCIVDTGSTDDTIDVLETHGIAPHRRNWVSFGHNLSEAFSLAKDRGDWLLRLDADMTVDYHPNLRQWLQTAASADIYNVPLVEDGTTWRLPLLVRGGIEWKYVGATHEYLDCGDRSRFDLAGLTVTHHADGSNRGDKFQRDIKLLREGVAKGDARAIFYTAESLRCLGRHDEASELFWRRANMGGWEEEAWFAHYMSGVCLLSVDHDKGIERLVSAYERRPHRAEPLQRIIEWCEQNKSSSTSDELFVELTAYNSN